MLATEYFQQNCWIGVEPARDADAEPATSDRHRPFMWGSDYPHDEGTYPHTRSTCAPRFHESARAAPDPRRQRRRALRLRPRRPRPRAEQFGPTVAELQEPLLELPENPSQG